MTDATPKEAYESVNIKVIGIEIHQTTGAAEKDTGWIKVPLAVPILLDLLKLQNQVNAFLADVKLDEGTYQQIRLTLSPTEGDNNVVIAGKTFNLTIPGGSQTGLKINHLNFKVDASNTQAVIFDFDTAKSIHKTGSPKDPKYMLKPVIKVKIGQIEKDGKVKTEEKGATNIQNQGSKDNNA